jgi:hypothetical protein
MSKVRQCILTQGSSTTTAWLDAELAKVGTSVTLKGQNAPEGWWNVQAVGSQERDRVDVRQTWHVGGL